MKSIPALTITHVTSSLDPSQGGTTSALLGMATAQQRAGIQVSVVGTFRSGFNDHAVRMLREQAIDVRMIGPCSGPLGRHATLNTTLHRAITNADIVHIHGLWEEIQFQAARIAHTNNKPYVFSPHGMLTDWSLSQKRFKKKLYLLARLNKILHRAARLIYTSQLEAEHAHDRYASVPMTVIPLGIDTSRFAQMQDKRKCREQLGVPLDGLLIGTLGRIHPGKGGEYLVPAMQHVKPDHAKLVMIGPDSREFMQKLRQTADQLGVADRILFTGPASGDRVPDALNALDLFVLPSDHENFGLAAVEAMAARLPVLLSEHVAIAKEIVQAQAGAIVDQDPALLAKAINHWLADSDRLAKTGQAARNYAFAAFDWAQIANQWQQTYKELLR